MSAFQFSILQNLGNLSPWYSVEEGTGQIPSNCQIEEVHLLHRHGARYPTTGSGSAAFAAKIMKARGFKACVYLLLAFSDRTNSSHMLCRSGALSFLNKWSYQLGAEILTPFGVGLASPLCFCVCFSASFFSYLHTF